MFLHKTESSIIANNAQRTKGMKVLVMGMGRTGTTGTNPKQVDCPSSPINGYVQLWPLVQNSLGPLPTTILIGLNEAILAFGTMP